MIYSTMIKKAMKISYEKHHGQFDKSGMPYIFHPIHVAEQMKDEDTTIVALLHDVIEDTDLTIENIEQYGFSKKIIDALKCLTHDRNVPYFEYIKKIATNQIARQVKIADLEHNSNLTRLNNITDEDKKRVKKYKECLKYLKMFNN